MKRDRHASEYERIRQRSRYQPPYRPPDPEFPEPDAHGQYSAERAVGQPVPIDEETRARLQENANHDARREAEARARSTQHSLWSNKVVMLREYQQAGVTPHELDGDGFPKFSLAFALNMGWTIEQIGDEKKLVAPARGKQTSKRREDYGNTEGS